MFFFTFPQTSIWDFILGPRRTAAIKKDQETERPLKLFVKPDQQKEQQEQGVVLDPREKKKKRVVVDLSLKAGCTEPGNRIKN